MGNRSDGIRIAAMLLVRAVIFAWIIATTAGVAGVWRAHLYGRAPSSTIEVLWLGVLRILWLPAQLSDRIFRLGSTPVHSVEDLLANIVTHVSQTFGLFLALILVVLISRNWLRRLRRRAVLAALARQDNARSEQVEQL